MTKTLGVAGLIASGKSTVACSIIKRAKELGVLAYHFDADKETESVIKEHKDEIAALLGLEKQGDCEASLSPFKNAISDVVFNDSEKRKTYEKFIWRLLENRLLKEREQFFKGVKEGENALFIFDAALLFSADWDRFCDIVLKVVCDPAEREKRFISREKMASLPQKERKNAFFLIEKAFEIEKVIDIQHNRKIIYTMNNTNIAIPKVLELGVDVVLNLLFPGIDNRVYSFRMQKW